MDDFPTAFVEPFPPEARQRLMTALAGRIRTEDVTGRLLEPGVFPDYLSMTTSERSGVGFFTTERFPLQDGFCSVQTREPNLCRAFHKWLIHLPESDRTRTAEETASALEELTRTAAGREQA